MEPAFKQSSSRISKRKRFHQSIRRQYIQAYQKQRRKEFERSSESNHQSSADVQEYERILSSINQESFKKAPNCYLQILKEILQNDELCQKLRVYIYKSFVIVQSAIETRMDEARLETEDLLRVYSHQRAVDKEELKGLPEILVMNMVFFSSFSGNGVQQSETRKINLELLISYIIGLICEVNDGQELMSCVDSVLNNGYSESELQGNPDNSLCAQIVQFYIVFAKTVIGICVGSEFQTARYNSVSEFYFNEYSPKRQLELKEEAQSSDGGISLSGNGSIHMDNKDTLINSVLVIIQNITASFSEDSAEMQLFVKSGFMNWLNNIVEVYPIRDQAMETIFHIYSNSMESILGFGYGAIQNVRQSHSQDLMFGEQEQDDYSEQDSCPGLYLSILDKIPYVLKEGHSLLSNACYIFSQILQAYSAKQNAGSDEETETQLTSENRQPIKLNAYYVQRLADSLGMLLCQIEQSEENVQYLGRLFVIFCNKFSDHIRFLPRIADLLQRVVRNFNEDIEKLKIRRKSLSFYSTSHFLSDPKQTERIDQMIKYTKRQKRDIIRGCTKLLQEEYERRQNDRQIPMYDKQEVSEMIINSVVTLWESNEFGSSCNSCMVEFLKMSVVLLNEEVILKEEWQERFVYLFIDFQPEDSAGSGLYYRQTYLDILELVFNQIVYMLNKSGWHKVIRVRDYLGKYFDHWNSIMQIVQGQIFTETDLKERSKRPEAAFRVNERFEDLYRNIERVLQKFEEGSQKMEIELRKGI